MLFHCSSHRQPQDNEEELRWVAIERLTTYDRLRKGMLRQVLDNGKVVHGEVDATNLGHHDKKQLMKSILKVVEEDNEKFLRRLRDHTDRVGIEIPKTEVRYANLSMEGDVYVRSRALPTLLNVTLNTIEDLQGSEQDVFASGECTVRVWDLQGTRHADLFVSASGDYTVRVWDVCEQGSTMINHEVLSCDSIDF